MNGKECTKREKEMFFKLNIQVKVKEREGPVLGGLEMDVTTSLRLKEGWKSLK